MLMNDKSEGNSTQELSARPLYQQVKDFIEKRIKAGDWLPDTKIPSENELVKTLGVSRMTVNRALRELSNAGYLIRLQGVGTYVAPRKPISALLEIRSIADEIRQSGGSHGSKVYLLREEKASPVLAARLELPTGSRVFHAVLVHCDGTIPIQLADRYVNPAIAPDFLKQDFTRITPNEYLVSVSPATEVEHVIEAVLPDTRTRRLLKISADQPCLVLHRKTWVGKTVATSSRFTYPGSRYRLGGRFKPESDSHRIIT